ncbi:MAG TPA: hypothetical protein VGX03_09035 [Candidatus Binatia bacterium]|nr:hypothetical protein [Candidatus Binatia bacterium]
MPSTEDVMDSGEINQRVAAQGVEFNPFLPEFRADPYPFYHRLRSADPIHWSSAFGFWLVTRYADAVAILRDLRFVPLGTEDFLLERFRPGPWRALRDRSPSTLSCTACRVYNSRRRY